MSENLLRNSSSISNNEEENSIIIWFQGHEESIESNNDSSGVNEDFIEIDLTPDSHEYSSEIEDSNELDEDRSNNIIFSNEYHDSSTITRQDFNDFENHDNSVLPMNIDEKSVSDEPEIDKESSPDYSDHSKPNPVAVSSHQQIKVHQSKLLETNQEHVIEFCKALPMSCYIEGLVFLLKLFNRLDGFLDKFVVLTNNCSCMLPLPSLLSSGISTPSWSQYLLSVSGLNCQQCSMEFILHHLNDSFLSGIAKASFITSEQVINSISVSSNFKNSCTNFEENLSSSNKPQHGWFRPWAVDQISKGRIISIIYQDNIKNITRNKVCMKLVRGYDDEKFHLAMNPDSMTDTEIETALLREEVVCIPKLKLLLCHQAADDYETIYRQSDPRFSEMNVIGQIIGTFRGFQPEENHYIRIPNMHRNGVLVVDPNDKINNDFDDMNDNSNNVNLDEVIQIAEN